MYRLPHKLHLNDRKNDCMSSFLLKKTGFFQVAPQATKSMKIYLKKIDILGIQFNSTSLKGF